MRKNECAFLKVQRVWAMILRLVFGMPSCSHYHGLSKESMISFTTLVQVSRVVNEARTRAQIFYALHMLNALQGGE